ncbi:MAG: hypothetical protein IJT61_00160, partial [Bacteroidales bacterium]|nr:hypothetical protein [Bacteroidales bacterium]
SICKAAVRRTFTDFNLLPNTLYLIPFHFASFNFPTRYLMNFINLQLVLEPQRYNNQNAFSSGIFCYFSEKQKIKKWQVSDKK